MQPSEIELRLTTEADAYIVGNLWPAYVHDIAQYSGTKPNAHGVLSSDPDCREWPGPGDWWSKPGVLFPYLVLADRQPAGFLLISSGPYLPSQDIDFCVHEFFVAHGFRGKGVAARAIRLAIASHPGAWEVVTYPSAADPIRFWRKTLPTCASAGITETQGEHPWGTKVIWRFQSGVPLQ